MRSVERGAWGAVLVALLGLTSGCLELRTGNPLTHPVEAVRSAAAAPPRPVTAEEINPKNAHQMADALDREMDEAGVE